MLKNFALAVLLSFSAFTAMAQKSNLNDELSFNSTMAWIEATDKGIKYGEKSAEIKLKRADEECEDICWLGEQEVTVDEKPFKAEFTLFRATNGEYYLWVGGFYNGSDVDNQILAGFVNLKSLDDLATFNTAGFIGSLKTGTDSWIDFLVEVTPSPSL